MNGEECGCKKLQDVGRLGGGGGSKEEGKEVLKWKVRRRMGEARTHTPNGSSLSRSEQQ